MLTLTLPLEGGGQGGGEGYLGEAEIRMIWLGNHLTDLFSIKMVIRHAN